MNSFCCDFCGKTYEKRDCYLKHIEICDKKINSDECIVEKKPPKKKLIKKNEFSPKIQLKSCLSNVSIQKKDDKGLNESNSEFSIEKTLNEDMSHFCIKDTQDKLFNKFDYNTIISEIISVAKSINIKQSSGTTIEKDGRIDSAMKERPFLNELKRLLLEKHPEWEIIISPPRGSCDIMINSIRINLKLTDCKSSDNSVNKPCIFYSITGLTTYPYSSNWNEFLKKLNDARDKKQIKKQRNKPTEYHYLVKNKINGDVLLKPIFDIHTYVSNASNDLQINWKNEFLNLDYQTPDEDYLDKVKSLLSCIQKSVKEMIERTKQFADADLNTILIE